MIELNTFRISLKEIATNNLNYDGEDRRKQFLSMIERVSDYRTKYTRPITPKEESKFEKTYLVMTENNVVLKYCEHYQTADETLRNRHPQIFAKEIAEAEVELEDIVIDAISARPLDDFQRNYMNLICGLENNLKK